MPQGDPSRGCLNFLHAAWKYAGYYFFTKHENFLEPEWKTFCRITMQPPLFEVKLKNHPASSPPRSLCFHV